ncbi:MAG: bifunctional ADP-dependent NAD(P)H-hydrate dehydratase/NAD(P)H-hydrate epimerase [Treponema sp.]|nr:bifunctional ADP-dependent NAD(P)H-hydrate dehydratase/NAD(P)H-hydrate epimerase [Treponema sp.]
MVAPIVSTDTARALDQEAQQSWGFNVHALIEGAGRLCAQALYQAVIEEREDFFNSPQNITVAAGTGNNAADAMVILRSWILSGLVEAHSTYVLLTRLPGDDEQAPWVDLLYSLQQMKVWISVWDGEEGAGNGEAILVCSDLIIDGISGIGISGPLQGAAAQMADSINAQKKKALPNRGLVASVDVPSGLSDQWEDGWPAVNADICLSIEPEKFCLYSPAARPLAGKILAIKGVFPAELVSRCQGFELMEWEQINGRIPKIRPDAYKHERGTAGIWAGSPGATGAALIAARGAQAAGAGLVRLIADDDIYPILASQTSGIMAAPLSRAENDGFEGRHSPDAMLLGPGWGTAGKRLEILEKALLLEKAGRPLILDADAIDLARGRVFSGSTILTPHPGEFSACTGIAKEELLNRPFGLLLDYSRELNATILFKGHVIIIAAPDGRLGVLDGMKAVLAAGGSGDLLAGFCAAIAARMNRLGAFDPYNCAAMAAGLLIAVGNLSAGRFSDPMELADCAAELAGEVWL